MPAICDSIINLCAIRVTRIDCASGEPDSGPNNYYVSNKPISLSVTPEIEAGRDVTLVGGCDCIVGTYRGPDKLKRFTFEFDLAKLEPALLEMMIGADVVLGGTDNSPIGMWYPTQISCDDSPPPCVALEAWSLLWEDDHQNPVYPYVHWIWPSTRWQIGPHTLNTDFLQPRVTGFSQGNPSWGLGPYSDTPEAVGQMGGFFYDTVIPAAECGYQTVEVS